MLEGLIQEVTRDGKSGLRYNFHRGQKKAWHSESRFVCVLAGTQGGKTSFGPPWLHREIQRRGPGDYMIVTPSYPLLQLKALPEFLRHFKGRLNLGDYHIAGKRFEFHDSETNVFFGHAQDPESLESATAKAVWLDEAGQNKFKLESWEAIQRRLSIHQGRALITTTPYNLGWLKQKVWDRWKAGDPAFDVIRFDSTENPAFPREEFERARATLPAWKFDLFYRAIFTRPAGLIYDAFDEERHKVPRFKIPNDWQRYLGVDFGGVNTAAIFFAEEPGTKRLYLYREYKAGGRTAADHARVLLDGEPMVPICVGGSKSEGQWRSEFQAAGLPMQEPAVSGPDSVEVGIDRVYGMHKRNELFVFDDLEGYLEEKQTYSRKLDPSGEPIEDIEDKNRFHFMDAERYIIGWIKGGCGDLEVIQLKTVADAPKSPGPPSENRFPDMRWFAPNDSWQPWIDHDGNRLWLYDFRTEDQAAYALRLARELMGLPALPFAVNPVLADEPEEAKKIASRVEMRVREFLASNNISERK